MVKYFDDINLMHSNDRKPLHEDFVYENEKQNTPAMYQCKDSILYRYDQQMRVRARFLYVLPL